MRRSLQAYQMHLEGVSNEEIAKRMELSPRAVYNYIWKEEHKEKSKEQSKRYYQRHATECKARSKRWCRSPEGKSRRREYMQSYMKEYMKKWYGQHKDEWQEYLKTRQRNAKQKLIVSLGGHCQQCGYSKNSAALDIHHYKKGVILLCANCHREIHHPEQTFLEHKLI